MKAALAIPLLLLRLAAARPVLSGADGAGVEAPHSPPHTRIKPAMPLPVLSGGARFPIDNRPQTPPSSAIPSVVLAEQKPIETTYLLSLQPKGHKQAVTSAALVPSEKGDPVHVATAVAQPAERPASQGQQLTTTTLTAQPCHHAYAAYHHRFNVAAIFLVALCVIVIVKAESRGSRDGDGPWGVIRLQINQLSKKQPLSIQAEPRSERVVAEKGRL